jgi:hypothetical protein
LIDHQFVSQRGAPQQVAIVETIESGGVASRMGAWIDLFV